MSDESPEIWRSPSKKVELVDAECQGCGRPVMISSDFYGCIFCEECLRGTGNYSYDKDPRNA